MASTILIIEDEAILARNMRQFLERQGFAVEVAGTIEQGKRLLTEVEPDLVLIDQNLPDGKGLDLIERIRTRDRSTKIIMLTAHGGVRLAVEAMKAGANDYLNKPVSLDEVAILASKLLAQIKTEGALAYYRQREERSSGIDQILGDSPLIVTMKKRILQMLSVEAQHVSGNLLSVLVTGETGTGKELVARAIHFSGPRKDQPFIEINCAALPRDLIESELFGHEKGAFTDAKERRQGLVQAADGGTLFLDEVSELPMAAQAKLLKVLEDQVIRPVGSVRDRKVNVRFVAATNADLEDRAANGEFRRDLMFRLAGIRIEIPPLRERGDDITLLACHFLGDIGRRYGRSALKLHPEAELSLLQHTWPGNVRELRNVVEQAVLLTVGDLVMAGDLTLREPPRLVSDQHPGTKTLEDAERAMIIQVLKGAEGNVTVAARTLGVSRDTLRYRMQRHALKRDSFA
jgi:two-component system, NtrC family, response regulator AtoC